MKTRLDEHAAEYAKNRGMGRLLRLEDMDSEDMARVAGEIFRRMGRTDDDLYSSYLEILVKYGIMCPHPKRKRIGINDAWFECGMCGCLVMVGPEDGSPTMGEECPDGKAHEG